MTKGDKKRLEGRQPGRRMAPLIGVAAKVVGIWPPQAGQMHTYASGLKCQPADMCEIGI
jgi:hypothetical protein